MLSPEEVLEKVFPVELVMAVQEAEEDVDVGDQEAEELSVTTSSTNVGQVTEPSEASEVVNIVKDEVEVNVDPAASRESAADSDSREALESDELEEAATSPDATCGSSGSTQTP